ncbi:hypothetical protein BKA70DRAFT_1299341 [Coprinopsis sp. MPI-PUGE-AT-0042]|nr:hypothetical protein BKA70DRAFT_1299341 [Coprinopsis sp. MPI-PUGE-AT-0042]
MSCKVLVKIGAHVATGILSVSALVMESVIGHVRLFHKASYVISSFFTLAGLDPFRGLPSGKGAAIASAWKREDNQNERRKGEVWAFAEDSIQNIVVEGHDHGCKTRCLACLGLKRPSGTVVEQNGTKRSGLRPQGLSADHGVDAAMWLGTCFCNRATPPSFTLGRL